MSKKSELVGMYDTKPPKLVLSSNTPKIKQRKCPNDTNGDGNCGRPMCPICGTKFQPEGLVVNPK